MLWTRGLGVLMCALLASGCLAPSYEIPRTELERLTRVEPARRGESVRAVQRFATADEPPPAASWPGARQSQSQGGQHGPGFYYWPDVYLGYGTPYYASRSRSHVHTSHPDAKLGAPTPSGVAIPSGKGGGKSDLAAVVVGAVAVGVGVGVALAASEGARYDGWVAVHPRHPIHLIGPNNRHEVVPLDELGSQHLGDDRSAVLVGHEGGGLWLRGRAPLDREGGTYRVGYGRYGQALDRTLDLNGNGIDLAIGYFPSQYVGFLVSNSLILGQGFGGEFHSVRAGLEVQWLPLQLWSLHLGGYGHGGIDWFSSGGGSLPEADGNRPWFGGGALAEVDLTTRLALTMRYGWLRLPTLRTEIWPTAFTVGLAIY